MSRAAGKAYSPRRRIGSPPATEDQRDHLTRLHLDVYGYVSAETADEITGMSRIRAAQETAGLTRKLSDIRALARARAELRDLHRRIFGADGHTEPDKLIEIATMDAHRVATELAMLRRMDAVTPGPLLCDFHIGRRQGCRGPDSHCAAGMHCTVWRERCGVPAVGHGPTCCNCGGSVTS